LSPPTAMLVSQKRLFQQYLLIGDISMLFNRLVSLRDQDRREMNYAKNLPRNSPASCLRGIADDLRQRMRQNNKRLSFAPVLLQ
jgi:hypothetical protein